MVDLTHLGIVLRFVGTFLLRKPSGSLSIMKRTVTFSARELRNSSGALLREAEEGRLSIITKYGRPAAVAVPFDGELLAVGVHIHLAVRLFEQRLVTLAQAAKLAGQAIEEFLDVLQASNVNVVDYPAEELAGELQALS